ncbi:MAG: thioredoxin-like negative regulator of GroEL, partial [Halieaceae bacterium]
MTKYYLKKLGSALLPLAMVSCSTNEIATPVAIAPEPTATVAASEVVVRPQRPIPADSLLPLLIAEFALRRQQMGTALDHYLTQSALLKDAGVSAHTARLAQYLKRDQDALKAALQWVELAPDDPEARLVLANLLARGGDPVTAATHMSEVLRSGGRANFTALAVAAARQGDKVGKQFLIA